MGRNIGKSETSKKEPEVEGAKASVSVPDACNCEVVRKVADHTL